MFGRRGKLFCEKCYKIQGIQIFFSNFFKDTIFFFLQTFLFLAATDPREPKWVFCSTVVYKLVFGGKLSEKVCSV